MSSSTSSESTATNSTTENTKVEEKKIEEPKVEPKPEVPEQTPEQKKAIDDLVKSILENQKSITSLNTDLCANNDKRLTVKKNLRESKRIQTIFQQVYQTPLLKYELERCKVDRHILMLKIMYCSQLIKEQKSLLEEKRSSSKVN